MSRFTGGWVKLHRNVLDKDIHQRPLLWALWTHLLVIAMYKPGQIIWEGEQRNLLPGQLILGVSNLAKEWGISRRVVTKWLHYLQKTERIRFEACPRGTLVTLCNWELYQSSEEEAFLQPDIKVDNRVYNNVPTTEQQGVQQRADNGSLSEEVKKEEEKKERKKELKKNTLGIRQEYSDDFNQFWESYLRKGDKAAAYRIYKELALTDTLKVELGMAIKNVVSSTEKQYLKDFERFLKTDWRPKAQVSLFHVERPKIEQKPQQMTVDERIQYENKLLFDELMAEAEEAEKKNPGGMVSMNRVILASLTGLGMVYRQKITKELLQIWEGVLGECTDQEILSALTIYARGDNAFFPKPGQIYSLIKAPKDLEAEAMLITENIVSQVATSGGESEYNAKRARMKIGDIGWKYITEYRNGWASFSRSLDHQNLDITKSQIRKGLISLLTQKNAGISLPCEPQRSLSSFGIELRSTHEAKPKPNTSENLLSKAKD